MKILALLLLLQSITILSGCSITNYKVVEHKIDENTKVYNIEKK